MPEFNKPKLLIVSFNFPYPLNNGGAIAQSFFLEGLKKEFNIYFFTSIDDEKDLSDFNMLHPEIKVINTYDFKKKSGPGLAFKIKMAASKVLDYFSKKDVSAQGQEDHLESDYIKKLIVVKSPQMLSMLSDLIVKENIQLLQLEFFETIDLIAGLPDTMKIIFVNHELRSKRIRLASAHSKTPKEYQNYLLNLTELYEYELLKRCSRVIVFNEDDKQILRENKVNAVVSPYAIPESLHVRKQASALFNKFIFVGSEAHFPNKEGLYWFLDEVYTKLTIKNLYPLWIIGKWSPEFRLKYNDNKNIIFKGMLESIHEVYDSAVMIAPILSGSGLRTKILDAFVNYMPVFCTKFACEGIDPQLGDNRSLEIFSNAQEFGKLVAAYTNEDYQMLANTGHQYYRSHYDHHKLLAIRKDVYQ